MNQVITALGHDHRSAPRIAMAPHRCREVRGIKAPYQEKDKGDHQDIGVALRLIKEKQLAGFWFQFSDWPGQRHSGSSGRSEEQSILPSNNAGFSLFSYYCGVGLQDSLAIFSDSCWVGATSTFSYGELTFIDPNGGAHTLCGYMGELSSTNAKCRNTFVRTLTTITKRP